MFWISNTFVKTQLWHEQVDLIVITSLWLIQSQIRDDVNNKGNNKSHHPTATKWHCLSQDCSAEDLTSIWRSYLEDLRIWGSYLDLIWVYLEQLWLDSLSAYVSVEINIWIIHSLLSKILHHCKWVLQYIFLIV